MRGGGLARAEQWVDGDGSLRPLMGAPRCLDDRLWNFRGHRFGKKKFTKKSRK